MADLYLTGGEQRIALEYPRTTFRSPEEWHSFKKAIVLRLDGNTSKIKLSPHKYTESFGTESPSCSCPAVLRNLLPGVGWKQYSRQRRVLRFMAGIDRHTSMYRVFDSPSNTNTNPCYKTGDGFAN